MQRQAVGLGAADDVDPVTPRNMQAEDVDE
jgi:hypothetical protein